jgi:hypothetical protein
MRQIGLLAPVIGLLAVGLGAGCGSDGGEEERAAPGTTATGATTTTAGPAVYTLLSVEGGDTACYLTVKDAAGWDDTLPASFDLCPGGNADASPLIGSPVTVERRPAQVMADSCAGDPNCTDTTTVQLVVAVKPASTPTGGAAAPGPLIGQTDTNLAHWAPSGYEQPQRIQQRIFGAEPPTLVADFPVTMNGCNLRQLRVKWRSVDSPVAARITDYSGPSTPPPEVRQQQPPALQGTMTLNGCEQPAFRTYPQPSGANLANIVVEVAAYEPAA